MKKTNNFKIAFVQEAMKTQHGIEILSAVLKEHNFNTEIFSIQIEGEQVIDNILKYNPTILACSVMTPGFQKMMQLIRDIKTAKSEIFTIMGGPHPTFYPQLIYAEEGLDAICRGEGEFALLELALSLRSGKLNTKIKNLWIRKGRKIIENDLRPLISDLDSLPFPDRDIYFKKYPLLAKGDIKFNIGRGCPFNCSFCFNKKMRELYKGKGCWVRFKSNKRMIREIREVNKKYPISWLSFNDDTFNIDKKRTKEFLELYRKEINIPFLVQLRIDRTDEEQIELLKKARVDRITVGIEHGDEEFRRRMLNRDMTNEQIIEFGRWLKERKIRLHTTSIMGFPEETVDMAFSTIDLNANLKPELASAGMLTPYPGTEIYEYASKNGCLREDFDFNKMTGQKAWAGVDSKVRSEIKNPSISELMNLRCFFMVLVKYPFLKPIAKLLIKFPYNPFYEFVWTITGYFKIDWKYATNWKERKVLLKKLFSVFKNSRKGWLR